VSRGRISTPVVLASSSAMIVIGIMAYMVSRAPEAEREEQRAREQRHVIRTDLVIDDSTAERAAESFYDAWRRRAWEQAETVAVGEALGRVQSKRAAETGVNAEDRAMAREAWTAMASAPLTLYFRQSDDLDGGLALAGIAAYEFVGRPYRREVEFLVVRQGERWRVERMVLGRVLTEIPDLMGLDE
jgi:hypothetical protein